MNNMKHYQIHQTAPTPMRPVEKILELALGLPETAEVLEKEALRLEGVLEGVQEPARGGGEELITRGVEVLEYQIEGIYGLLDAEDQEQFQNSCRLLLTSDSMLQDLESQLSELEEAPLLTA